MTPTSAQIYKILWKYVIHHFPCCCVVSPMTEILPLLEVMPVFIQHCHLNRKVGAWAAGVKTCVQTTQCLLPRTLAPHRPRGPASLRIPLCLLDLTPPGRPGQASRAPRPTVGLVVVHADPLQLRSTVPAVAPGHVDPVLLANHLPELKAAGGEVRVRRDPRKGQEGTREPAD